MRKSQFTEQQVVAALRQAENGAPVGEVCRELGISEQTFYRWKRKFAGTNEPSSNPDDQSMRFTRSNMPRSAR